MSFYKTLKPYYDELFPTNEKALDFLTAHFKEGDSILDVGAGTGNMAISLVQKGFHVTAMEPEESMAEQIRLKAQAQQHPIHVTTKSMQQLCTLDETYHGIYCIGNTLAHLHDLEEFRAFFQQTFQKLQRDGIFIFQIVNYEQEDFVFPLIEKAHFSFHRSYKREGNYMLFTIKLSTDEGIYTSTTPLFPATAAQLYPLLEECGFHSIEAYGNFARKKYDAEAPALIMVAKKSV